MIGRFRFIHRRGVLSTSWRRAFEARFSLKIVLLATIAGKSTSTSRWPRTEISQYFLIAFGFALSSLSDLARTGILLLAVKVRPNSAAAFRAAGRVGGCYDRHAASCTSGRSPRLFGFVQVCFA